jgi:integrase
MNTKNAPQPPQLPSHSAKFEAVIDSRKRKVRGLWRRGTTYYAQIRVALGNGRSAPRRFPLEAENLDQAKAQLEAKRTEKRQEKREKKFHRPGRAPKFDELSQKYLASEFLKQKKASTQRSERQAIARWQTHMGGIAVDEITPSIVESFREKRLRTGTSARTVNLDTIALRHVLSMAKRERFIENLVQFFDPKRGGSLEALKQRPAPRRRLLTKAQFGALLAHATETNTKNAEILRYYLRFLALTGAREQEALGVRRCDLDFAGGRVMIGAGGVSKNSRERTVDFSLELRALLKEMEAWLPPDTTWLFPSPQRGAKDIHAHTLRESFKVVRKKASLEGVGFHDLRHFFASQCVMAGIDFMTIAAWLGHSDGGILVGKVYGHLADTHKQDAARKLRFFT